MGAKFLIVLGLAILVLGVLTEAVNYKSDYCGNQEYVGNDGGRYPHLHCGSNFLTFSRGKKKHDNLQGKCDKVLEIIDYVESNEYINENTATAITDVLRAYYEKDCRTQMSKEL